MKSYGIMVPRQEAEKIRRELLASGVFNRDCRPFRKGDFVVFPTTELPGLPYTADTFDFPEQEKRPDYPSLVEIREELREYLPSSFDVVGDIGIVKIPDEVAEYTEEICRAIQKANHLRLVAVDRGVCGDFRVRKLVMCAGDGSLETTHREFGIKLRLDPSKVYFSPRLSAERWRVASMVEEGEKIADMFAGIGPFSIMIAKHRNPAEIEGFDINPEAIQYFRENIPLNRIPEGIIHPHLEDAREGMKAMGRFDRIIMNLPHNAHDFLDVALEHIKQGGTIHYYEIAEADELKERLDELESLAGVKRVEWHEVKTYSPTMRFYAFDVMF